MLSMNFFTALVISGDWIYSVRRVTNLKIALFLLRIIVSVVIIYVVCITSVNKAMGFLSCNAMPVISFGILVNAISEVSAIVPIRPT